MERSFDLSVLGGGSSVEVFPAAAGAFFLGKTVVSGVLKHVLALLRSSRLPQALFFSAKRTFL